MKRSARARGFAISAPDTNVLQTLLESTVPAFDGVDNVAEMPMC